MSCFMNLIRGQERGSGLSFADGHSEIRKWRSPMILIYGRQSRLDTRLDTQDATWLWERTTRF